MPGTETMQEYWNGPAAERWIAAREALDRSMEGITRAALAMASPRPGERALDLGCGCGTTALLLREQVGPGGWVEGIDVSAPMLEVARGRAAGAGVRFTEADAGTHRFDTAFDLAFSRFGVMFFSDPVAGFGNIRRALAAGGRLCFVCWRAVVDNPWMTAPVEAVRDLLPPIEPGDPDGPGPFALADRARLDGILARAGFTDVRVTAHDDAMYMGETTEAAAAAALRAGPLGRMVAELPGDVIEAIRQRLVAALARFATPHGVAPPAAVWLVDARG